MKSIGSSGRLNPIVASIEPELLAHDIAKRIDGELEAGWRGSSAEVREAVVGGQHATVRGALEWLTKADSPPQPACGEIDHAAQTWALAGLPVGTLLRACWIERSLLSERLTAEIQEQVTEPESLDLSKECDRRLCRWAEAVTGELIDCHTDSVPTQSTQRRLALLREILSGGRTDSVSLGYEFGRYHLALIAWGAGAEDVPARVADAVGCQVLVAQPEDQVVWAWLGGSRDLAGPEGSGLEAVKLPGSTAVAFGDCLRGIAGFRTSHIQARSAMRVADLCSRRVSHYHEVALEALITQNVESARLFVDRELGALHDGERTINGDDERSRRFRETLEAYFEAGSRSSGAAAMLGVTDETVSNRLRRIEERLGMRILERQGELQAALRAWKVLDAMTSGRSVSYLPEIDG